MPKPSAAPGRPAAAKAEQVVQEGLPLDLVEDTANPSTNPPVETALDDDEGGADPIDPETGQPYDETDPGATAPPARRVGSPVDD